MATPEELEVLERTKRKYKALLTDLLKIRNKLDKFSTNYNLFIELLADNVELNNKMFDNNELLDIKKEIENVKSDINGNLIPRVASKT